MFLLFCLVIPFNASSSELDRNWAFWLSNGITSYSYTLKSGAGPFGYYIYKVRVKGGECKAKSKYIYTRTPIFWKKASCQEAEFSHLYRSVKKQMHEGYKSMHIAYDENYRFIAKFEVVPNTEVEDVDWRFEVTHFRVR